MILDRPELWENLCQTPAPPPVKRYWKLNTTIIKNGPSSSTSRPLFEEMRNREPIPFPFMETGSTKPNLKTKPKRNRKIALVPLFKTEFESKPMFTYAFRVYSKRVET